MNKAVYAFLGAIMGLLVLIAGVLFYRLLILDVPSTPFVPTIKFNTSVPTNNESFLSNATNTSDSVPNTTSETPQVVNAEEQKRFAPPNPQKIKECRILLSRKYKDYNDLDSELEEARDQADEAKADIVRAKGKLLDAQRTGDKEAEEAAQQEIQQAENAYRREIDALRETESQYNSVKKDFTLTYEACSIYEEIEDIEEYRVK